MAIVSRAVAVCLAGAMLSLLGCVSTPREQAANELGVEIHSVSQEQGIGASLAACMADGRVSRYVAQIERGASSWYEVVRTIDQCNIDAARYYTGPETLSRILGPLDMLGRAGTGECLASTAALRQRIVDANREIVGLVGSLASLCQPEDAITDVRRHAEQLREQRAKVCVRINRALDRNGANWCINER